MLPSMMWCSPNGHIPKTNSMAANPFACSVLIGTANRRDEKQLRKAIVPLMTWIDPCLKLIQVSQVSRLNSEPTISPPTLKTQKRRPTQRFCIPCPAVSIMLFLQENGVLGSKELQKSFHQSPWRLHHRIELVNVHSPGRTLADQRFYQAHADTPLWAVCPIDAGREHLRINIFVRNFPAMVEFYRIITGVEMETNKDNFCWFLLYSQPGFEIRLSLKYVDNVDPYPLENVQLFFEVSNVRNIKTALGVELKCIGSGCYWMTDPDGNFVVLHTTENIIGPFNVCYKERLLCHENHSSEFRDDLRSKFSLPTDTSSSKFSTLPRNFTYIKKNTSTTIDSGLVTSSKSSHVEDSDIPDFFKLSASSNTSRRLTNCKQKMTNYAEKIFTGSPPERFSADRKIHRHLSFRSDSGYVAANKDELCGFTNLSRRKQGRCNSSLCVPSNEEEPRLGTALRRSNSALIDFSKYVIKKNVIRVNPEPPLVSDEIFV